VTLARVDRSRGRRGEVVATSLTDDPERLRLAGEVIAFGPAGILDDGKPLTVENVWEHQGRLVVKLRGVDSISEAERLRGCDLCIPRERRLPAPEGSYHLPDLIGCRMDDAASGKVVGVVEGWIETDGPVILEVKSPVGEEIMVPFARSIVREVDLESRRIRADLPDGLLDLNR
jgi:16S rRNA processing protein RimM